MGIGKTHTHTHIRCANTRSGLSTIRYNNAAGEFTCFSVETEETEKKSESENPRRTSRRINGSGKRRRKRKA